MKKIISLCLVAVMLLSVMIVGVAADDPAVSVWDGTSASTSLSGTGIEADPWLIQSAADFKYFADTVNANHNSTGGKTYAGEFVKLTVDIDLGGHKWIPIGYREKTAFQGTFDGDGHSIVGLSNNGDAEPGNGGISYRNGLFGGLGNVKSHNANQHADTTLDTVVKNLTVAGEINLTSTTNHGGMFGIGGLAGFINQDNYTGTAKVYITNVTVNVNVTVTGWGTGVNSGIGAVCGLANGAVFTNVVNNGNVTVKGNSTAYAPTGGFAGRAENCTFTSCVNNGDVSFTVAKNDNQVRVGGFVGQYYKKQLNQYLTFEYCVNNGNVTAERTTSESGEGGKDKNNIMLVGGLLGGVYYNISTLSTWTDGTTPWRNYMVTMTNCANTGTITSRHTVASVTGQTSTGGFIGSNHLGTDGANNNGGGFKLIGCANTGTIVGHDEGRACDLIGCVYTNRVGNFEIEVKNCVTSGAYTSTVCALKDWKEAYKGTETNATKAAKRVRAIVAGNANTGDNTTLVVAMVAVLALGTAFVVSKKVAVRAR